MPDPMMEMTLNAPADILIVERTPEKAAVYRSILLDQGHYASLVLSVSEAMPALEQGAFTLVLMDLQDTGLAGMDFLRRLRDRKPAVAAVVIVADGTLKVAVETMRLGANETLIKPVTPEKLQDAVMRAVCKIQPVAEIPSRPLRQETTGVGGFIGQSPAMQQVYRTIQAVAGSSATVFITGESGTGKEVAAETIHSLSPRRNMPFIAINCAAIPKDLIESELFGHVKGSFTGAIADRIGAVRQAQGGTLFLDEIAEMQIDLQSKLLRFLQSGSFQAVGGHKLEKSDVRIICATNRPPLEEVRAGRFRSDLYYRLHVVPLVMPPLRQRGDDVLLIADTLLHRYGVEEGKHFDGFDPAAKAVLAGYFWPGNVRQLQNVIRSTVVMQDGPLITPSMLNLAAPFEAGDEPGVMAPHPLERIGQSSVATDPGTWRQPGDICLLEQVERGAIEQALRLCDENVPKAAALLGVNPSTIYRKRQGWNAPLQTQAARVAAEKQSA